MLLTIINNWFSSMQGDDMVLLNYKDVAATTQRKTGMRLMKQYLLRFQQEVSGNCVRRWRQDVLEFVQQQRGIRLMKGVWKRFQKVQLQDAVESWNVNLLRAKDEERIADAERESMFAFLSETRFKSPGTSPEGTPKLKQAVGELKVYTMLRSSIDSRAGRAEGASEAKRGRRQELETAVQEAEAQLERVHIAQQSTGLRMMEKVVRRWEKDEIGMRLSEWRGAVFSKDDLEQRLESARESLTETKMKLLAVQEVAAFRHMKTIMVEWVQNPVWRMVFLWKTRTRESAEIAKKVLTTLSVVVFQPG